MTTRNTPALTLISALDLALEADGAPMTRDELLDALALMGCFYAPKSFLAVMWSRPDLFYRVDPRRGGRRQALYGRTAWRGSST